MKLLCFDLDNTLIHSDRAHAEAYDKALIKLGYERVPIKLIRTLFGRPKREVVSILIGSKNKKKINDMLKWHDYYLYKTAKYTRKIRGVINLLKKLKKKYNIAVLSNCSHKHIELLLNAANIDKDYFNLLIGYDDVKHSKPWPDEVIKAEKLMHHKASYMIGDSIYDIRAGKKAHVKTIGVLTGNFNRKSLKKEKPTLIVKSVKDLIKYL